MQISNKYSLRWPFPFHQLLDGPFLPGKPLGIEHNIQYPTKSVEPLRTIRARLWHTEQYNSVGQGRTGKTALSWAETMRGWAR